MELEIIKVDKNNIMEVITDETVYVIHDCWIRGVTMSKVEDVDVKDLLSEKNLVVRIKNT